MERGTENAQVRVRVPSKVNLFLSVRGVRDDGYHDVVTVLQTLSIYDTLIARLDGTPTSEHPAARRFMDLAFTVDGGLGDGVPADGDNLAVRAARLLMGEVGVGTQESDGGNAIPVTHLHLTKRIPVAAGMAGGSADAAGALVALNQLWQADLDREKLQKLASELGADVPFCVAGGTALATGTGANITQVLARGMYYWVVGITDTALSAAEVYRVFDAVGSPTTAEPDAVLHALRNGDAEALGAALYNDLEVAAIHLRPTLADAKDAMLRHGALGAVVSGSGPTVVALVADLQHATALAERVSDRFDRVEIAISPAGGPDVVVR